MSNHFVFTSTYGMFQRRTEERATLVRVRSPPSRSQARQEPGAVLGAPLRMALGLVVLAPL